MGDGLGDLGGRADPDDQRDASGQVVAGVGEAFDQEPIMPALGLGVVGGQAEDGEDRELEGVADLDRMIEGVIVDPRWARCIQ